MQPLMRARRLIRALLRDFQFDAVDTSAEQNVRVVFSRRDDARSAALELDDLSSGERRMFPLMLPFIERQVESTRCGR
jgi:hypothetical protein